MLQATRALLNLDPAARWGRRAPLVRVVTLLGSAEDAEALLPFYLAAPEDRYDLVELLVRHGGPQLSREMFERFDREGRLNEHPFSSWAWGVGWHGVAEVAPRLLDYVEEGEGTAGGGEPALHGLAHLPLDGLEGRIRDGVRACFGRSFFPEHLPALAGCLGDAELVDEVIAHGRKDASWSFMGGVVLAPALLGEAGRERFREVLWDPAVRVWDSQAFAGALGMRLLGMTVGELYAELRARCAWTDLEQARQDFILVRELTGSLVAMSGRPVPLRFAPPERESPADVYRAMFEWSTPHEDDSVAALALSKLDEEHQAGWLAERFRELERNVEAAMGDEALLAELLAAQAPR